MKWHQFWTKIFLFFQLEKEDLNDSKYGWQKVSEIFEESKYQVICYTRELENSDILVMRIHGGNAKCYIRTIYTHI